jgi:hypothetical protein
MSPESKDTLSCLWNAVISLKKYVIDLIASDSQITFRFPQE